ncbi:MAG TPA: dimethylsulfonioproprionate lyase family protein [Candidatus Saccharimonadales bacterium]|nr:dimethylsulfonioproprionate lyase family protein [Candidatus Saccharimonadales bacterium]
MNDGKQRDTSKQPFVVKRGEGETIKALGSEITFLFREPGAWSLTRVSAPRDVGAPPHDHDFDESYYVMSGSLWLMAGGKEVELGAGEFIHIPGGTVHAFKGTSDAPTQILILQAPGDAEEFFRACAREIKKIPDDLARMPELGARHGIRLSQAPNTTPRR